MLNVDPDGDCFDRFTALIKEFAMNKLVIFALIFIKFSVTAKSFPLHGERFLIGLISAGINFIFVANPVCCVKVHFIINLLAHSFS